MIVQTFFETILARMKSSYFKLYDLKQTAGVKKQTRHSFLHLYIHSYVTQNQVCLLMSEDDIPLKLSKQHNEWLGDDERLFNIIGHQSRNTLEQHIVNLYWHYSTALTNHS